MTVLGLLYNNKYLVNCSMRVDNNPEFPMKAEAM